MPIYEYLCEGCGRISELMQKIQDPPPRTCPECGSKRIAKLVSRSAFQLRGGGWYSDLYASKRKDPKASSGGASGDAAPAASGTGNPVAADKPSKPAEKPAPAAKPDAPSKAKP